LTTASEDRSRQREAGKEHANGAADTAYKLNSPFGSLLRGDGLKVHYDLRRQPLI
jgi:hypothetical protein